MNPIGIIHTALAVIALGAGLAIFTITKGTARHRMIGYIYVAAMVGLNLTALLIYRLFGRFGPFHGFAIASLITVVLGFIPALTKRPRQKWLDRHYNWILWSYVGLIAAAASEILTRIPIFNRSGAGFAVAVLAASVSVVGVGVVVIQRKRRAIISRMMEQLRTPE